MLCGDRTVGSKVGDTGGSEVDIGQTELKSGYASRVSCLWECDVEPLQGFIPGVPDLADA